MHGGYDNPLAFAIHFVEIFFLEEIKFTYFVSSYWLEIF